MNRRPASSRMVPAAWIALALAALPLVRLAGAGGPPSPRPAASPDAGPPGTPAELASQTAASGEPGGPSPEMLPEAGRVLWLRADRGLEAAGGRVHTWHDQSGAGHVAQVPHGLTGPAVDASDGSLRFGQGAALRISGQLLPQDARELTILGVGRAERPLSIGLFSIRHAARPLIQLDVDEHARARFIVRDGGGQTVAATTPAVLGAKTLFGGVLEPRDPETRQARVLFGDRCEPGRAGALLTPWVAPGAWIGALRISGGPTYFWHGGISEIVVYRRALEPHELQAAREVLSQRHQLSPPAETSFADSWNVLAERPERPVARELEADVCIVGAGSGGVGAAIAAARQGVSVVLVERQQLLGGTGTNALVSNWEPGPGCSIAEELFHRMKAAGGAGVGKSQPVSTDAPMGYLMVTEGEAYERTLVRALPGDRQRRRVPYSVPYQPEAFDSVVREILDQTGHATVLDQTTFFRAEPDARQTRVRAILAEDAGGRVVRIRARVFIDATGDVWLARALGCQTMLGVDPRSRFDEPSAPEEGLLQLNALTRCYLIVPRDEPQPADPPEAGVPFPRAAFVTGWSDGPRMVNMMPTLPGRSLIDLGYDECLRRTEPIVRAHWHWLQQIPEFQGYELAQLAPMLGIRESHRVVTRYVLTEHDLLAGLPHQSHPDIIAVADHPSDIHGAGGGLSQVDTAYGVPYRCLIPAGSWENLLVACRGSGFSRIAASSVRLQRTLIQLGHAAGVAAAMAVQADTAVDQIDIEALVRHLDAPSRYPLQESFVLTGAADREPTPPDQGPVFNQP